MRIKDSNLLVKRVNYMPFGESHIPGLRLCMAMFAALAFLLGVIMAFEGQTSIALTNFCGALFFIFAYHNPDILLTEKHDDAGSERKDAVQEQFLWTSLAVGVLAVLWEFKDHLPLG